MARRNSVRRQNILKTSKFAYNASVQEWYVMKLTQLVEKMVDETNQKDGIIFKKTSDDRVCRRAGYFSEDANVASQARILLNKLRMKFDSFFSVYAKSIRRKNACQEVCQKQRIPPSADLRI